MTPQEAQDTIDKLASIRPRQMVVYFTGDVLGFNAFRFSSCEVKTSLMTMVSRMMERKQAFPVQRKLTNYVGLNKFEYILVGAER